MSGLARLCHLRVVAILAFAPLMGSGISAATASEPAQAPAEPSAVSAALPDLEELVERTVMPPIQRGELPGAVVTIVKDGQVILLKGYGYADLARRAPVDPRLTLFRIGSITKTFTWAALTQLIEQGKVGLDQPIEQLLPRALHPEPSRFDAHPILVRHLFTHTGGFEDKVVNHFFLRNPNEVLPLSDELTRHKPTRIRAPGISASYSNYGAALAGAIIENVSGELYADYLEHHILSPLGMTNTTAREPLGPHNPESMPASFVDHVAQGYISVGGRLEARPFEYISHVGPAGSISSTGADMGKYMLARLRPGTLLSTASEARMQSRLFANAPELPGVGYGWMLGRAGALRTVWHNGGTMAFHSMLVLVPEVDLGIFISTNASTGRQLLEALPKAILTTYFPAARVKPTPIAVNPAVLASYEGSYLGDRLSATSAERFFAGLIAQTRRISVRPDGLAIGGAPLTPVAPDVFASANGDLVIFRRDETGGVASFTTTAESYDRLPPWRTPMALMILAALSVLLSFVNLLSGRSAAWPGARRQRIALALNLCASAGWLVFLGCLVVSFAQMMQSPLDIVFTYPPTALAIGLWIGVCTAALSIAATVSAMVSLSSCSSPRRIQYVASSLVWTGLMLALHDWKLLGLSA